MNTSLMNLGRSSSRIVILISGSSNKKVTLWHVCNEVPSELAMSFSVSTFRETYDYDQYSETNMMHFSFSLLRIKGLHMFRALLAHPQEALHKRHLVYCVLVMSVGCTRIEAEASILVQPTDIAIAYCYDLFQMVLITVDTSHINVGSLLAALQTCHTVNLMFC
jgi:hypothetical protein